MPAAKGRKRKRALKEDDDQEITFKVPEAKNKKRKVEAVQNFDDVDGDTEVVLKQEEPRRSPNGYILPDPLPPGLVITDLRKNRWKIGKSIGLGGFGEIYSAALLNGDKVGKEDYVIKVEPHTNGPLFVEINFYCRSTKKEDIEAFADEKRLRHLGIAPFQGSGSFEYRNKRLRFLVLPRYGTDLQTVLDESRSSLSLETASSIALQIIDSYEYLHSKGFVHKDVKGSNLLFARNGNKSNIFLVDFGLTSRFRRNGLHKPFEPDLRSAHEGTVEFASRDAHLGCVSRRGDLEVLLYNLIDWLGGRLPWDIDEHIKPSAIHQMKIEAFHDIHPFLTKVFAKSDQEYPEILKTLMNIVQTMPFEATPDYDSLRSLFRPYVKDHSGDNKSNNDSSDEVTLSLELNSSPSKKNHNSKKNQVGTPEGSRRKGVKTKEAAKSRTSQPWNALEMAEFNKIKDGVLAAQSIESLKNPTPAMILQLARMKKRRGQTPVFASPQTTQSTRRRGAVAKRRLGEHSQRECSKIEVKGKFARIPSPKKTAASEAPNTRSSLRQQLATLVGPRISNLVRSIFPFNQEE